MDSYTASNGSCFTVTLDYFQEPSLGGRSSTKPLGDHGTLNADNCWFILFYHMWGPTWMESHWNSIWLRNWSHVTSHYTRGWSVTTLCDFGGVLGGWPLDTFFWALTVTALGSWVKWLIPIARSESWKKHTLSWKTNNLI